MEAVLNTPSGRISLGTTAARIGSDTSNQIVLNDTLAAPVHAEITPVENGHQITDLDSPRGVLVNGQFLFPRTPQQLQSGDIIFIGSTSLIYKITNEASSSPFLATGAKAEAPDLTIGREIADQPTDAEIPAQPRATSKPLPSGPGALTGEEGMHPVLAETAPAITPTAAPIPPTPVIPGLAPVPPSMQAVPQAFPAQGYALSGAVYPPMATYPPAGATNGVLVQPSYSGIAYAPGGYAIPGQFQAMAATPIKTPAAQRREKMLRWIIAIIVVLLLLGASNVGTYAFARATVPKPVVHTPTFPSPQKALQTYCQGILTGNSEEIYDLLSDEAKVHTSLDDIQKIFDEIKLLNSSSGTINAQYSNCGFDDIRTSNSLAVATVLLSITLTIQFDNQGQKQSQTTTETVPSLTSLVWEHNQWKIDVSSISQSQPKLS